jgi:4-hydroxy-3-methylbut-2-enyl diphosphate reductase
VTGLVICTALSVESRALLSGLRALADRPKVVRVGMGPERAAHAAALLPPFGALAVTGFCGALDDDLRPGDVLVATEVRSGDQVWPCPSAPLLAGELARAGLPARTGPLLTAPHVVSGAERRRLARRGARAADMESAPLAAAAGGLPFAAVRVVVDTPAAPLLSLATLNGAMTARRTLSRVGPVLARWAAAAGARRVLLARPRSHCPGVQRAISLLEQTLDLYGAPVYFRTRALRDSPVLRELEHRGAVFVDDLDEVPKGAVTVLSPHGASPGVWAEAARLGLHLIDATCPLVAELHAQARRLATRGDLVAFVGRAGHEEAEGLLSGVPGSVALVRDSRAATDAANLPAGRRISYLVQTTLAADEAEEAVTAIRRRFPDAEGPPAELVCQTATDRGMAVQAVAPECDLVLVAGTAGSPDARRLAGIAARHAPAVQLVRGPQDVPLDRLAGVRTVGLTACASAPSSVVDAIVAALEGLGPVTAEERQPAGESRTTGESRAARGTDLLSRPKEVGS